jgi:hypothetical protein
MTSPLNRRESHYGKVREFFKRHSLNINPDAKSTREYDNSSVLAVSVGAARDRSPPMSPTSLSTVMSIRW